MPRRARRAAAAAASAAASTATTGGGGGGGGCVGRGDAEVATTLAKVLRAVQEQRELRLDAGQARKRGRLLEAELNALKAEHERTRGIKEKLDTLSRELTRQNRTVIEESERVIAEEKRRRDGIVRRFNDAMREVNEKLARQGAAAVMVDDDDDGEVRDELVRAVRDAEERYRCRTEHFESGVRRRALERQLAAARIREANVKREKAAGMLKDVRLKCASAREEHKRLHVAVARFSAAAGDATTALEAVRAQLTRAERKLNAHCRAAKEAQQANARVRNDNVATGIRIKAMHSEEARLQSAMSSVREEERKERGKREALERLHKQVTAERAELRNDVLIMQVRTLSRTRCGSY